MHRNDEGGGALLAACALVSLLAAGTTIVRLREDARAALGNPSARVDVFAAGRAVEGYALTFGALPERLEVTGLASDVYDPWGRRLVYLRKEGHDFTVECLGRDGLVGGAGEDQDFVYASAGGVGGIVVPAVGAGAGATSSAASETR